MEHEFFSILSQFLFVTTVHLLVCEVPSGESQCFNITIPYHFLRVAGPYSLTDTVKNPHKTVIRSYWLAIDEVFHDVVGTASKMEVRIGHLYRVLHGTCFERGASPKSSRNWPLMELIGCVSLRWSLRKLKSIITKSLVWYRGATRRIFWNYLHWAIPVMM